MIGTEQIRANAAKIPFDAKQSAAKTLNLLKPGVFPSYPAHVVAANTRIARADGLDLRGRGVPRRRVQLPTQPQSNLQSRHGA
jgi:hypothetical protein